MKKIDRLKLAGEVKETKNGWRVVLAEWTEEVEYMYTPVSITKNTYKKIGQVKSKFDKKMFTSLFLSKATNKFYIFSGNKKHSFGINTFRSYGYNRLEMSKENWNKLIVAYFYGRKCEWLKHDSMYWNMYSFFKSFSSLKEAKNYLGFTFINTKDFRQLLNKTGFLDNINLEPKFLWENKASLVFLKDVKRMCEQLNIPLDYKRKLKAYHDELVEKINLNKIQDYSDEPLFEPLVEHPDVIPLVSKRDIFKEGIKQKHCVGSRKPNDSNHYYHYKGITIHLGYDGNYPAYTDLYEVGLYIRKNIKYWKIKEAKMYRNAKPPVKLLNEFREIFGIEKAIVQGTWWHQEI